MLLVIEMSHHQIGLLDDTSPNFFQTITVCGGKHCMKMYYTHIDRSWSHVLRIEKNIDEETGQN